MFQCFHLFIKSDPKNSKHLDSKNFLDISPRNSYLTCHQRALGREHELDFHSTPETLLGFIS